MTRVLILSQYYYPEGFIPTAVAEGLLARGYDVEVLTAFPHYRAGRVHGGYRQRLWLREEIHGVPITRVPVYPSHDRSPLRRILTYLSFAASASVLGRFLIRRPDFVYVYHPPTTSGLAALTLRAFRASIPILYHVQDLWPEAVASSGMVQGRGMLRLLTRLSRFMYRRADRILAISPGFKARIAAYGARPSRIDVIYNWANEEYARPVPADPDIAATHGMAGRFNVVYAGNMGSVQDLDTVLDAAKLLEETRPSAQFLLIGGGTEESRLKARVAQERITNLRFLPRCSPGEVASIIGCADASLVHLRGDPVFDVWIPGKTQASLAMGKPVLLGVRGDAADLVAQSGGGLTFEPSRPEALADAVVRLMALPPDERLAMGLRARDYYGSHLARDIALDRICALVEDLRTRPSSPRGGASSVTGA